MIKAEGPRQRAEAQQMMLDGSAEEMPQKDEFSLYLELAAAEGGLLITQQAAQVLGVSAAAIHDLIQRGKLRAWEMFGRQLISARDVHVRRTAPKEKGGRPRKELQAA